MTCDSVGIDDIGRISNYQGVLQVTMKFNIVTTIIHAATMQLNQKQCQDNEN